jgi:hypothetical protein
VFGVDLLNSEAEKFSEAAERLMADLQRNSRELTINYKKHGTMTIQCFYPRQSKSIIDRIDELLGHCYDFSPSEINYLVEHAIKYRMSLAGATDD